MSPFFRCCHFYPTSDLCVQRDSFGFLLLSRRRLQFWAPHVALVDHQRARDVGGHPLLSAGSHGDEPPGLVKQCERLTTSTLIFSSSALKKLSGEEGKRLQVHLTLDNYDLDDTEIVIFVALFYF